MTQNREYELNRELDYCKVRDNATRIAIREAFVYYCALRDVKASCELARLEEMEKRDPSPMIVDFYAQRENNQRIACKEIAYAFYLGFNVDFNIVYERAKED